ncbi:MAG: monovalent cation/H+ antiporter complex subunit F [Trueperaceae bacterium]
MVIDIALGCLAVAIVLATVRIVRGPTLGDRITGFDFLGVNLAVLVVVVALRTGFADFLDAALLLSILGFLSTVALALYLLHGRVMK